MKENWIDLDVLEYNCCVLTYYVLTFENFIVVFEFWNRIHLST